MAHGLFSYPGEPTQLAESVLLPQAHAASWDLIRQHGELRVFRRGEIVVGPNDADRALWVVIEGGVSVRHGRRAGDQLAPGGVFGEFSFLTGTPAGTTVRAAADATLLRLGLSGFEALAGQDPVLARHLLFDLARILAARLHALRRVQVS